MGPLGGIQSLNRVVIISPKNSVIESSLWYTEVSQGSKIFFCLKVLELGLEIKVPETNVVLSSQWVIYYLVYPVYFETKV